MYNTFTSGLMATTTVAIALTAGMAGTAVAADLETISGRFSVLAVDRSDGSSDTAYAVRTDAGRFVPVEFRRGEPTAKTGDVVRLVGHERGDAVVVSDASRDMRVADPRDDPPRGPKKRRVAFIMVNFAAGDEPVDNARLSDMFHRGVNTREDIPDLSVQAYYDEVSYGKERFVSSIGHRDDPDDDVFGWYTLAKDPDDPCNWGYEGEELAIRDGLDLDEYQHVAIMWPYQPGCRFLGAAEPGGMYSFYNVFGAGWPDIFVHELGHNVGMGHASSIRCEESGVAVSISETFDNCTFDEYGDYFDVMGWGGTYRHMSVYAKARAGYLAEDDTGVIDASDGGTFRIVAAEVPPDGEPAPRGIRIAWRNALANWHYYVELRTPRGFDRNPPADSCAQQRVRGDRDPRLENWGGAACIAPVTGTGVQIRLSQGLSDEGMSTNTWLVDATPETATGSSLSLTHGDSALPVGRTFHDRHRGISITLDSVEPDPADLGGPPKYATVTVRRSGS